MQNHACTLFNHLRVVINYLLINFFVYLQWTSDLPDHKVIQLQKEATSKKHTN